MGNLSSSCFTRRPTDPTIRNYWKVSGFQMQKGGNRRKRHGTGLVYINEGKIIFERKMGTEPIAVELGDVQDIALGSVTDAAQCSRNSANQQVDVDPRLKTAGTSQTGTSRWLSNAFIVVTSIDRTDGQRVTSAFKVAKAEQVREELRRIVTRHRQKPRIFEFNSIDLDGREIDVP